MAIWPEWKNVPSPMKTICLLVMNGIDARSGSAAEAHAAVVVHELFGGREHQHGVAAGVAVGDQIDRAHAVMLGHVFRIGQVLAQFQQHRRAVPMRAAGAERRRARDDVLVENLQLRLAGPAQAVHFRRQAAIAAMRVDLLRRLDQRDQSLRQHRKIQPARCGNAFTAIGEHFSEQPGGDLGRLLLRQSMEQIRPGCFFPGSFAVPR